MVSNITIRLYKLLTFIDLNRLARRCRGRLLARREIGRESCRRIGEYYFLRRQPYLNFVVAGQWLAGGAEAHCPPHLLHGLARRDFRPRHPCAGPDPSGTPRSRRGGPDYGYGRCRACLNAGRGM
jgi:hypothetical protein